MEVFTVVEHRIDPDNGSGSGGRCCKCRVHIPFGLALTLQMLIAFGLAGLLGWNLVDSYAARNGLPIFGRLGVILSLLLSFYLQKTIFSGHSEIHESQLLANLVLYVLALLAGVSFWLVQMQYSSSISPSVANYSSVEPVILVTLLIIGIYCMRKGMTHYENSRTEELDIYTTPMFPKMLGVFSMSEMIFGLAYAVSMNLMVPSEYEFTKRCGCLVAIFVSAVVNELAITFSKESRNALCLKTAGFFINLVCTQLTWWLSYYKERQLTLYGLGVGFLTLLFGVLYTVEMSLQTAQLNEHNPDHSFNIRERGQAFLHRGSGDSKKDNNEEEDSDSQSFDESVGMKVLSTACVIGFAVSVQIGLSLLPVVVLIQEVFYPATDPQKLSQDRIGNWLMWALGFFASLIINEVILFQKKVHYLLISVCNLSFCINFCVGCVLSYRGLRAMTTEHGLPLNLLSLGAIWVPFFFLSHFDFSRLTRFSLRLEQRERKRRRKSQNSSVSLFFASGVQGMVAVAAFLPTTDFVYFPGKIFSILTFPSLAFIAEVIFKFGKSCRGPFLVTFSAFFLGAGYSQLVWYMSVFVGKEEEEFLGLRREWLLLLGVGMGVATFIYVIRFLYVIITNWENKRD